MDWRSYLRCNRQERWAVAALVLLTFAAWSIPFLLPEHASPPTLQDWPLEVHAGEMQKGGAMSPADRRQHASETIVYTPFDPNTLSREGWYSMGLRDRQVRTLLAYRSRGGRFRRAEDLGKIYGLSPEDVQRLMPYVRIPAPTARQRSRDTTQLSHTHASVRRRSNPEPTPSVIEVNTADSLTWLQLSGIGPGWTARILRFRRRLGGFMQVEQLAETYGLPDSVFQSIRPFLTVDATKVQPVIALNQATAEQLAAHPYLSYRVARAIIAYREQHGPFGQVEDLSRVALVTAELFERMRPYVRLE
ncbi:MAG: hypothetical protein FJX89_04740 [Bacteroidetes bacterium]|nr:hypothetical protein [Bacteroidota bacterium]